LDHPVTVVFDGIVYAPPKDLVANATNLTAAEQFVASVIDINKTDSVNAILDLWTPADRLDVQRSIEDVRQLQASQAYFRQIRSSKVKAIVLYGSHELIAVEHVGGLTGRVIKIYPVVNEQQHYFLTNGLADDPIFQYFVARLSEDLLAKN
jgi:hypothetical protein